MDEQKSDYEKDLDARRVALARALYQHQHTPTILAGLAAWGPAQGSELVKEAAHLAGIAFDQTFAATQTPDRWLPPVTMRPATGGHLKTAYAESRAVPVLRKLLAAVKAADAYRDCREGSPLDLAAGEAVDLLAELTP